MRRSIAATRLSRHLPAAKGRSRSAPQTDAESITDPVAWLRPWNLGASWLAAAARPAPGFLHQCAHRAPLIKTGFPALRCCDCFRREYPHAARSGDGTRWRQAMVTIAEGPSIRGAIRSGGDPLSTEHLQSLARFLAAAPREWLRFEWLRSLPARASVVLHVNHAQEVTAEARATDRHRRVIGHPRSSVIGALMTDLAVEADW
jgi:hypothetical protein